MSRFQLHLAKWKRVDLKTTLRRYDSTPLETKYFNTAAIGIDSGVMAKTHENSS